MREIQSPKARLAQQAAHCQLVFSRLKEQDKRHVAGLLAECHWMLAPSSFTSFFIACLGSFNRGYLSSRRFTLLGSYRPGRS